MSTPYYPIQFEKLFRKIFQTNNTIMIAISKKLQELCKTHNVKNIWMRPNPINENKFYIVIEWKNLN